jgi:serine/threonine protein kinase
MSRPAASLPRTTESQSGDCHGELTPGMRFDGLVVERLVGTGAMANLYQVRDADGNERVIKVPRLSLALDPVCSVAFENELRLAPYLTDFRYAYMPRAGGTQSRPYLSMSYIRGHDLWSHLKQHGALCEIEALELGIKIVHAVGELHRQRIVHLDLKLSNVMLTPDGEIRLIDFGLANHLDLPDLIFESFREPKGTPAYIAPEQFIGVRDEPRSDLYSVGVMLFELVTGKLPFREQSTMLDVFNRINSRPESPRRYARSVSQAFEVIVARCLQASPDDRFASMDALGDALKACRDSQTVAVVASTEAAPQRTRLADMPSLIGNYLRNRWIRRHDNFYGTVNGWSERHRARRPSRPYRILATLNLGKPQAALGRAVLQQALQLARAQTNTYLTIMSVVFVDIGMASGEKESERMNAAVMQGRQDIRLLLDTLNTSGVTVNINVVASNHPVDVIQQYACDYGVDLVVIGCRPKNPLAAFVQGRTGYKILTAVRSNVLIVHEPLAGTAPKTPPVVVAAVNT